MKKKKCNENHYDSIKRQNDCVKTRWRTGVNAGTSPCCLMNAERDIFKLQCHSVHLLWRALMFLQRKVFNILPVCIYFCRSRENIHRSNRTLCSAHFCHRETNHKGHMSTCHHRSHTAVHPGKEKDPATSISVSERQINANLGNQGSRRAYFFLVCASSKCSEATCSEWILLQREHDPSRSPHGHNCLRTMLSWEGVGGVGGTSAGAEEVMEKT